MTWKVPATCQPFPCPVISKPHDCFLFCVLMALYYLMPVISIVSPCLSAFLGCFLSIQKKY